jgi:hypothetical protein
MVALWYHRFNFMKLLSSLRRTFDHNKNDTQLVMALGGLLLALCLALTAYHVSAQKGGGPLVQVNDPIEGQTVSGTHDFIGAVFNGSATSFNFLIDSETVVSASDNGNDTWTAADVDTTQFSDGVHTVVGSAVIDSVTYTSPEVQFTVDNSGGGGGGGTPTVTMTSPIDGACVSGTFNLVASVANGTATQVQVMFNGIDVPAYYNDNEDGTWTFALPSEGFLDDGPATFGAHATVNGTPYASDPITLTIDNTTDCAGAGPSVTVTYPNSETILRGPQLFNATVSGAVPDAVSFTLQQGEHVEQVSAHNTVSNVWQSNDELDTTLFDDGSITITAVATVGESTFSSEPITTTVGNNLTTMQFIQPADGFSYPAGPIPFEVMTAGPSLDSLSFEITGQEPLSAESNDPFWTVSWDATEVAPGSYTITPVGLRGETVVTAEPITITIAGAISDNVLLLSPTENQIIDRGSLFVDVLIQNETADSVSIEINGDTNKTPNLNSQGNGHWSLLVTDLTEAPWVYGDNTIAPVAVVGHTEERGATVALKIVKKPPTGIMVPYLRIQKPSNLSEIKGSVALEMTSTPHVDSANFSMYGSGGLPTTVSAVTEDGGATWKATWDSTKVPNQDYLIVGEVLSSGSSFASPPVSVHTNNSPEDLANAAAASSTEQTTSTQDLLEDKLKDLGLLDPTATGTYSALIASAVNPSIDVGMNIQPANGPTVCPTGSLIKLADDRNPQTSVDAAIYYCAQDGKRYSFPNDKIFFSWFKDFSQVKVITASFMSSIPLGGNVSYRPGFRMIKIQTDPKVYAVSRGGILRWITSEAVAKMVYGEDWNTLIDDVSDAFFVNYQVGKPITE